MIKRSLFGFAMVVGTALGTAVTRAAELEFFGLLEFEASYFKSGGNKGASTSDVVVATVETGLDVKLSDKVSANVTLLYEEDETDLELDQASLTWQLNDHAALTYGQTYLPFGSYTTHLVNDTMILEIAELRESSASYSYTQNNINLSAFVFNGDADRGHDTVQNIVLHSAYTQENWSAHLDYINNVYETDMFADVVSSLTNADAAAIVGGTYDRDHVSIVVEYFTIFSEKPTALQLETAYKFNAYTIAAVFQTTRNFAGILPKKRMSIGANTELDSTAGLAFELWHDKHYGENDGGSGANDLGFVVQLAANF